MTLWAVLFWLAVWQAAGMAVGDTIFFVTPAQVFLRLFTLAAEPAFWQSLLYSFLRIVLGFLAAAASGAVRFWRCWPHRGGGSVSCWRRSCGRSAPYRSFRSLSWH